MQENLVDKELRVEMQIKNNILYHAIYDQWKSVSEFCRETKLHQSLVGDLLNLKDKIWKKRKSEIMVGEYRAYCVKIADVLGFSPEELFPPELYNLAERSGSSKVFECFVNVLPPGKMLELVAGEETNPEAILYEKEIKKSVKEALSTLTPREAEVLKMRFGIDSGGDERTLEEVSKLLGVSRQMVAHVVKRAFRKLHHPKRSKIIEFLLR